MNVAPTALDRTAAERQAHPEWLRSAAVGWFEGCLTDLGWVDCFRRAHPGGPTHCLATARYRSSSPAPPSPFLIVCRRGCELNCTAVALWIQAVPGHTPAGRCSRAPGRPTLVRAAALVAPEKAMCLAFSVLLTAMGACEGARLDHILATTPALAAAVTNCDVQQQVDAKLPCQSFAQTCRPPAKPQTKSLTP